jgi:hypothetical protein
MRYKTSVVFVFLLLQAGLFAQTKPQLVPAPAENSFAPILSFLSSDWMEGREAGAKGGFLAADYMASMMQVFGLKPFGDPAKINHIGQSYFQNFEILRHKTEKSSLAFISRNANSQSEMKLAQGIDYEVEGGTQSLDAEASVVFAGYGITATEKGYDDYKALDVRGKIVVVLKGFPGYSDTTSAAWKKLIKFIGEDGDSFETKIQTARKNGAIALILIDADGKFEAFKRAQSNQLLLNSSMNSVKNTEEDLEDYNHILPNDTANEMIPGFRIGSLAVRRLIYGTGLNLAEFELKVARTAMPSSMLLKDKLMRVSVTVKTESLLVRNVLGIIPGKDTTKYIILGGHYDHLGMHNGVIYNGSDDNASGASGLLALAKTWGESGIQPACNLIFASWSAEEDGLLGSQYFVQEMQIMPKNILLYINMDMISRSVKEDTAGRQLSIGTRTSDENLRELARKTNATLKHPFELDLWDVTGHSGSDYASFTAKNIPIMTYNTGLHEDYHTPRDIAANADLVKMGDVLKVVNASLQEVLENISGK